MQEPSRSIHPAKVSRSDLEELALGQPPFVSIYVDLSLERRDTLVERVAAIAGGLLALDAPAELVERTTTAFLAPSDDRAAMGVVASTDGRSIVATSPEPLVRDLGDFSPVPRLATMIEWSQQMLTHAVVRRGEGGNADLVVFGADGTTHHTATVDAAETLATEIAAHGPAVAFVVGADFEALLEQIRKLVATNELRADCRIIELDDGSDDEVADAVVRHTASVVAERKVEMLQDFRFEQSHGKAIEGIENVLDAANAGRISTLLVNADPDDHRRAVIGPSGLVTLHDATTDDAGHPVPLADALIWATLARGGTPVILPATGEQGPTDDIGAFLTPRPPLGLIDR